MNPRRVAPLLAGFAVACVPAGEPGVPPPQEKPRSVPVAAPASLPAPVREGFQLEGGSMEQGGWLRGRAPGGAVSLRLGEAEVPMAPDGGFFAGLDRDAPASLVLQAALADGRTVSTTIAIARRNWPIERVNVPLRGSTPSEAFMAVRAPELAATAAARKVRSDSAGWAQAFVWPVMGRISGRFGAQRIYQGVPGAYHSGLDIAPGHGVAYVAPADGVVVLAAETPFTLEGMLLIVDHGMGLNSAFLHSSRLAVKRGDRVRQGQLLGYIGATGRASGPHLHWSLKWGESRLDPLLFVPPLR